MENLLNKFRMLPKFVKWVIWILGILIFLSPIIAFVSNFGWSWSKDISAWNNTANYVNNIYTPILSLIAAILVFYTYWNQRDFNNKQIKSSKIAEFAVVRPYFETLFQIFEEKIQKDTSNITASRFFDNHIPTTEYDAYKNYFPDFEKTTMTYSSSLITEFDLIEKRMLNYEFNESPNILFKENLKRIGEYLNKQKTAIENLIRILNDDNINETTIGIEYTKEKKEKSVKTLTNSRNSLNVIKTKYDL